MENAYGIGVTNRYELFYVDEDGNDPLEALIQKKNTKAKQKASIVPSTEQSSQNTGTTNKTGQDKNKNAEKENKSSALNKNQDKSGTGGNKNSIGSNKPQSGTAKTDTATKGKGEFDYFFVQILL